MCSHSSPEVFLAFYLTGLGHAILGAFTSLRRLPIYVLVWHLDVTSFAVNTAG